MGQQKNKNLEDITHILSRLKFYPLDRKGSFGLVRVTSTYKRICIYSNDYERFSLMYISSGSLTYKTIMFMTRRYVLKSISQIADIRWSFTYPNFTTFERRNIIRAFLYYIVLDISTHRSGCLQRFAAVSGDVDLEMCLTSIYNHCATMSTQRQGSLTYIARSLPINPRSELVTIHLFRYLPIQCFSFSMRIITMGPFEFLSDTGQLYRDILSQSWSTIQYQSSESQDTYAIRLRNPKIFCLGHEDAFQSKRSGIA